MTIFIFGFPLCLIVINESGLILCIQSSISGFVAACPGVGVKDLQDSWIVIPFTTGQLGLGVRLEVNANWPRSNRLGLLLNEYGEKNNLKVTDDEVRAEIQKQIKSMPGQEKMVLDYYQKNPSASQSLKGSLYEEKIIDLIKSKIKLTSKEINSKEAEKIISEFNKPDLKDAAGNKSKSSSKDKLKSKKISKK